MRISLTITAIFLAGMMSGCCCGPINNCGSGCGGGGFVDYGGAGCGVGCPSPLNALAQVRKAFVCGSGCGEAYMDEWCSTPPDACDPCVGGQFVGGAMPCVSPCWYPGKALLGFVGGVVGCAGQKFCQFCNCVSSQGTCGPYGVGCASGGCGTPIATTGCGTGGCGGCNSGGCGSNVMTSGYQSGGQIMQSGAGCSTCSTNNMGTGTRIATQVGPSQPMMNQRMTNQTMPNQRTARSNAVRRGASKAESYHTRNTLYR